MREIAFLLTQDFALMHLGLAQEAIRIANRLDANVDLRIRIYCVDDTAVQANNGQVLLPTHQLADPNLPDALFVIASLNPEQGYAVSVEPLLQRCARSQMLLGAIDCGACFFARNHLLDRQQVAVHWEYAPVFAEHYPLLDVTTAGVVKNGRWLTCSGGLAVGQMMVATIEHLCHKSLAQHLAQVLNYSRMDVPEFSLLGGKTLLDPVEQALQIMRNNLARPLSLEQLVAKLTISKRTLNRLFSQQGYGSPMQTYLGLRLRFAQQLLKESGMSIQQAAFASGFSSAAHLSKAYMQHFGVRPKKDKAAVR